MRLFDTCFLIDLQKEYRRGTTLGARRFLTQHPQERFAVSVVSVTAFLEGFTNTVDGEAFLRPFQWLDVSSEVAREAARIRRDLRARGRLIGDFDILIAATAIAGEMELVTDDGEHFGQVRGLRLENYREG